jgi:argininosuccinate lyase
VNKNLLSSNSDKLWSGRFSKANDKLMETFNASLPFDKVFFNEDISVSQIHAKELHRIGILKHSELNKIIRELENIRQKIKKQKITFLNSEEDIHTKIENELKKALGPIAGKLHTARSRNDQSNMDVRIYLRKAIDCTYMNLKKLLKTLCFLAENHQKVILPGFTHLQPAQPITLSFFFLAYFFMIERDLVRLTQVRTRVNALSMGAGALAGVNYPIDRNWLQKKLDFDKVLENALDAVSDRDYLIEYHSVSSILMMHLSRLSEELILFSTPQFDFVKIDEQYATGSSIMPNKINPDSLELIRGKTGRVYGNLFSLLTIMKSLPLAYNKDLQEDKEGLFDTINTLHLVLPVMDGVLGTLKINPDKMRKACERGFLQATDGADYLAKKNIPFREAHKISATIVKYLEKKQKTFSQITLKEFKIFSPFFEKDILPMMQLENLIKNKVSVGSTSPLAVKKQIRIAKQKLQKLQKLIIK